MTADPKPYNRAPAPRTEREKAAHGQWGQTHDEAVCAKEQSWRLMLGPEPLGIVGFGMRYAPYKAQSIVSER